MTNEYPDYSFDMIPDPQGHYIEDKDREEILAWCRRAHASRWDPIKWDPVRWERETRLLEAKAGEE